MDTYCFGFVSGFFLKLVTIRFCINEYNRSLSHHTSFPERFSRRSKKDRVAMSDRARFPLPMNPMQKGFAPMPWRLLFPAFSSTSRRRRSKLAPQ